MPCGEGIKLFTSSVMWAVWTEEELHETKVRDIFFITQIHRVRFVSVNEEASRVKPSKKKFEKSWKKNFEKKMLKKSFEKKILEKKFSKKI